MCRWFSFLLEVKTHIYIRTRTTWHVCKIHFNVCHPNLYFFTPYYMYVHCTAIQLKQKKAKERQKKKEIMALCLNKKLMSFRSFAHSQPMHSRPSSNEQRTKSTCYFTRWLWMFVCLFAFYFSVVVASFLIFFFLLHLCQFDRDKFQHLLSRIYKCNFFHPK